MINVLKDSYGRALDYLRVSITDRCNLRCIYCMPPEGVQWKPHQNILTFEQIIRIVKIACGLGIRKIRVTGGEPLLRKGAVSFLKELKTIPGIENVSLTTNGLLLGAYLDEAQNMGENVLPDSINISVDTLSREKFKKMTLRDNLHPQSILPLIDRLLEKQITVKINCVPVRSFNDGEIASLAELAKNKNIAVRFIELMPIGAASNLQFVSGAEVKQTIEKTFGAIIPCDGIYGNGPAVYYNLAGFTGKIGFINAVTHGFCETCNRLRLTSQGFLKLCLSNTLGLDLRTLIAAGVDDDEITGAIIQAVAKKPRFHTLSNIYNEAEQHSEGMFKIGG